LDFLLKIKNIFSFSKFSNVQKKTNENFFFING